ncbi:MAG: hypothetical protein DRP74_06205 [Candidatus Omnitrophota bacterium]|nr:MAG: hypothetical protein DRP74_06205 [Candidatus Omnitrophota bacterium]
MKNILAGFTLAFILGIFSASRINLCFWPVYILAFILLITGCVCIKKEKLFCILLFPLFLLSGILSWKNLFTLQNNHVLRFISAKAEEIYVQGSVASYPRTKNNARNFMLAVHKIQLEDYWQEASGEILVSLKDSKKEVFYGDLLILKGKIRAPFRPYNISRYRGYGNEYRKSHALLNVSEYVEKIKNSQFNLFIYYIFKFRKRLENIINKNLSPISASVLNAVILGLRGGIPERIREVFLNTGTVHIIAISGLHLGIAAFIILILLKLAGIHRRLRYIITIAILFIYSILTGMNVPVVRAMIMASILLFAGVIRRQANIYNSLSVAALTILFINPTQMFDLGFQLSFLSVVAIVGLSPKINTLFSRYFKKSVFAGLFLKLFSVSLSVWLVLSPLIIFYFRVLSLIAIIANVIICPFMAWLISASFIFLIAGLIYLPLADFFACMLEISISFLLKFLYLLYSLPGSYFHLPRLN